MTTFSIVKKLRQRRRDPYYSPETVTTQVDSQKIKKLRQ